MITSTANEKVKFLRSLHSGKARQKYGCYLVEGITLVEEALKAGVRPVLAVVNLGELQRLARGAALISSLDASEWVPVSQKVLEWVATTVTPQPIVAAVPIPPISLDLDREKHVLILDGVGDPGNVGTILRTAQAAGLRDVVLMPGSADVYSPKVVRSAAGAHFHLNLIRNQSWRSLAETLTGRAVFASVVSGGSPHYEINWTKPSALIIGSEAHGVSAKALEIATGLVSIPMAPGVDSLNAAVAAGIILFEAFRQWLIRERSLLG